jgi:hypothetical protein
MTTRREPAVVLVPGLAGALLLLVVEPATGLAALAGAGAGALVGARARVVVAVAVLLLGLTVLWIAAARTDVALGAGAALVALAAAATAVRVRRWPPPRRAGAAPRRRPGDRDTWDALDRGEDPTA